VEQAVACEPVSADHFPVMRENTGKIRLRRPVHLKTGHKTTAGAEISPGFP
jgi:hypothetical protein